MKIIGSLKEVMALNDGLAKFVSTACPYIHEDWNPEQIGWIFVLDISDLEIAKALNVVPHHDKEDHEYVKSMTVNLDTWVLWEGNTIHDQETGYLNLVAVIGQDYGFSIFMAEELVKQLPNLRRNLDI